MSDWVPAEAGLVYDLILVLTTRNYQHREPTSPQACHHQALSHRGIKHWMSAFQPALYIHKKLVSEACVQVTGCHKLIIVVHCCVWTSRPSRGVDCRFQRGMLEDTPPVVPRWVVQVTWQQTDGYSLNANVPLTFCFQWTFLNCQSSNRTVV